MAADVKRSTTARGSGRLARWLNRPLFGPRVIPARARANPELLPEEEFPVHCPGCGYLLRGLPGAICPECGTPFDRGRLLVEQYVHFSPSRAQHRIGGILFVLACLLVLAPYLIIELYLGGYGQMIRPVASGNPGAAVLTALQRAGTIMAIMVWAQMLGVGLVIGWEGWMVWVRLRRARARRRVIESLVPGDVDENQG